MSTEQSAIRNPQPAIKKSRSPLELSPWAKLVAYIILGFWTFVVLFPLYWLIVTSFKLPIHVNSGPV